MRNPTYQMDRRQALFGLGLVAGSVQLSELLFAAKASAAELKADPRWALLAACGDAIIPPSDTPGASTPDAVSFAILALDQGVSGLSADAVPLVQTELNKRAAGGFLASSVAARAQAVAKLDADAFAGAADPGSVAWAWRNVKRAILMGYYTSEFGASKELTFDPVPGGFTLVHVDAGFRDFSNGGGPF